MKQKQYTLLHNAAEARKTTVVKLRQPKHILLCHVPTGLSRDTSLTRRKLQPTEEGEAGEPRANQARVPL